MIHSASVDLTGGLEVIFDFIKAEAKNLQYLCIKTQQER